MIQQYSREMYEALDYYERNAKKVAYMPGSFEREDRKEWQKGYYFKNGEINNGFRLFLAGISYGYNLRREEEEL